MDWGGGGGGGGGATLWHSSYPKMKQNGHYTCFVLETLNSFLFYFYFFTFIAVATALLYNENSLALQCAKDVLSSDLTLSYLRGGSGGA